MKSALYFLIIPLFFAAQIFSIASARSPQAISSEQEAAHFSFTGKIISISDNVMKLQNGERTLDVNLPEKLSIQPNIFHYQNLKVDDQVTVDLSRFGEVHSIDVIPGDISEVLRWSIPVALSGFGMLILGLKLWRKYHEVRGQHTQFPVHVVHA
jgi:hypothetical protein